MRGNEASSVTQRQGAVDLARAAGIAALLVGAGVVAPLEAQDPADGRPDLRETRYLGGGPVMNLPKVIPGGMLMYLPESLRLGFYVQGQMELDRPSDQANFEEGMSPEDAVFMGDVLFEEEQTYWTVGGGLVWPLSSGTAIYGGVGYGVKRNYENYYTFTDRRGANPYYWVEADDDSRLNANAGFLIQVGERIFVRGGYDFFPNGGSLGGLLAVPW